MKVKTIILISLLLLALLQIAKSNQATANSEELLEAAQYHKYLWGTYRPDLLYEYNTIGNEGLAFGIIYHSNKELDISQIERCPVILNQNGNGKRNNQNHGFNQKLKDMGGRADKCRSIPSEYEKLIRYELDQNSESIKADYKMHDGSSYVQELIQDQNEVIMNIKTLKTNFSSLDNQSWSTFINTQRSLPKRQSQDLFVEELQRSINRENFTQDQINLNHSIYFYFVCQGDSLQYVSSNRQNLKQVRVIDCFESIKQLNQASSSSDSESSPQQKLKIKVANSGGEFTIEDIKNQDGFKFEYRLVQEQQLNFRSNGRGGNMRRILQSDLVNFKAVENTDDIQNDKSTNFQKGNVLFIKAQVKDITKSIFRISYDSKDREPISQNELIHQMKNAENNFLNQVKTRILSSYNEVPKPIVQVSSVALSKVLGNLFFISDSSFYSETVSLEQQQQATYQQQQQFTCIPQSYPFFMQQQSIYNQQTTGNSPNITNQKQFYAQKEIFGISKSRMGGNLTPSLYDDGFTLSVIAEWDQQLAEMILSNWIAHRNVEGLSYLDNQNALKIVSTSFSTIHIRQLSQSAPSIIFTINKLFSKYNSNLKNINKKIQNENSGKESSPNNELLYSTIYEKAVEIYDYAEDILFNLLFSSQDNFKHSHKKGNQNNRHKKSQGQKSGNRLEHLKWYLDEFTNTYASSGLDDLTRHKQSSEELVSSVDYLSWSIFVCQSLVDMAKKLSQINPELKDEKLQYEEVESTLQKMLLSQLKDDTNLFKDKIQKKSELTSPHESHPQPFFSSSISIMNTYPYLFETYSALSYEQSDSHQQEEFQKGQLEILDSVNLNLLTEVLRTQYGIANSNSTLTFEQTKQQVQNNNSNKQSMKGCYETGEISLIQNYLSLRRLFKSGNHSESVKKLYREIHNNLLENVLKHFDDFGEIYEVYSKQDGKLQKTCRQIPAYAVFLLILNEDYQ